MSLKTRKQEFYPVEAIAAAGNAVTAAKHSPRKWRGAMPEKLARHEVRYSRHTVFDEEEVLLFGEESCALCLYDESAGGYDRPCCSCPLYETTGVQCGDRKSPYQLATNHPGVSLMIEALEKAAEVAKRDKVEDA